MIQLNTKKAYLLFLLCGFLLYGNTLNHDYTLDDAIVITENQFTKKGFSGIWDQLSNDQFMGFYGEKKELVSGGRYRPLSMVLFNIEYALFGENPFFSHLMNVLFYILNGILLFMVLKKLLPEKQIPDGFISLALLVSLLWFFHPIHTEVVANVKGRDEIMAFCGELLVLLLLLKFINLKKTIYLIGIGVFYFFTLLAKENAITWLAIFPLTIYFFKPDKFKKAIPAFGVIFLMAICWFYLRYQVVGGGISNVADNLMNDPFLESTVYEKYATIVYTLGKYIQLLFFPHPLTYDYYPKHIPIVDWKNPMVLTTLLIYLFLIIIAVKGFFKKHITAFGILFFIITLSIASNLIFPIGAFMNERFVYVSSFGFSLILGYYLIYGATNWVKTIQNRKNLLWGITTVVFLAYAGKTISRNQVWKDNLTLATHDANISINGAKSNVMAGGLLTEEASKTNNPAEKRKLLEQAIKHLQRAVSIYPEYIDALLLMGNAQWDLTKDASNSMPYYMRILSINPMHSNAWQNIFIVLEQAKSVDYKIKTYKTLLKYNPNEIQVYLNLGRAYGKEKNNLSQAQYYFNQGLKVSPQNYELLSNLGTVYGLQSNYSEAIKVLEKAASIKPNIAKVHIDLGLSYYYNGEKEKARAQFDQAVQLDSTIDRNQFPI